MGNVWEQDWGRPGSIHISFPYIFLLVKNSEESCASALAGETFKTHLVSVLQESIIWLQSNTDADH